VGNTALGNEQSRPSTFHIEPVWNRKSCGILFAVQMIVEIPQNQYGIKQNRTMKRKRQKSKIKARRAKKNHLKIKVKKQKRASKYATCNDCGKKLPLSKLIHIWDDEYYCSKCIFNHMEIRFK